MPQARRSLRVWHLKTHLRTVRILPQSVQGGIQPQIGAWMIMDVHGVIQGFSGVVGSCGTRLILEHENRIISEHPNKNTLWKKHLDWHWQQARNEGAHAFTHTDAFSFDTNTFPPFSRIKLLYYAWEPASRHDSPQHNNTCSSEFHYPNETLCGRTRRGRSKDAQENHTLCLRNTLQDIKDKDPNPNITLCCKKTRGRKRDNSNSQFSSGFDDQPSFWRCKISWRKMWRCQSSWRKMRRCKISWRKLCRWL